MLFMIFSCQSSEQKQEGILSREEMVRMLSEVYILEEKISRLNLPADSSQQIFDLLKAQVFEANGVQDTVFKKSFDYYMDRPQEMEAIYTALVDSLQLHEQRSTYRQDVQ